MIIYQTIKISIIGPSKLAVTKETYDQMIMKVMKIIRVYESYNSKPNIPWRYKIHLISGGAALSDHVAISLYLKYRDILTIPLDITIYLPSLWDKENKIHQDTGDARWYINPGKTANSQHRYFSKIMGFNSLNEINTLYKRGKVNTEYFGFHKRNDEVAKSDVILAFSGNWDNISGGTKYTYDKATTRKKYIIKI